MQQPLNFQIVGRLLDYIRSRHLQEGDLLPPENVLMQELQVSRVVLREGLSYLKALELVSSRRGSGYRIRSGCLSGSLAAVMHALTRSGLIKLSELQELRRLLEIGAIADAVTNANAQDRQEIAQALEDLEKIESVCDDESLKKFTLAELRFHRALLRPARCKALEIINQALEDFFTFRNELSSEIIRMDSAAVKRTNLAHKALADAFLLGEASAAVLLMLQHLHSQPAAENSVDFNADSADKTR
ncbi:MAG: FadR family transcriptional regulator [Lentisphaerae bacterium]|nr:FadR family transcriptional regulator [Lentisphaerota bacterium]